jgi:hypothetical protein
MELEDSDDIKMNLLKRSAKHREELENEVRLLSARTESILTNALIIGGTLAASYFIVRQFTRRSVKTKKVRGKTLTVLPAAAPTEQMHEVEETPGIVSQIGAALASQATVFLLGLAKEKLAEYLQQGLGQKQENNDERP